MSGRTPFTETTLQRVAKQAKACTLGCKILNVTNNGEKETQS
jgi:hypothetical protein